MAFDIKYMQKVSAGEASDGLNVWSYNGTATGSNETQVTIAGSGYLNNFQSSVASATGPLKVGDSIFLNGNDTNAHVTVTAVTPNVTVAAF